MYSPQRCIFILTTNHMDRLDPALIQPGRADLHVEFTGTSRLQAKGIFKNMFPDHSNEELESLADQFSAKVESKPRTPADIQNYLQRHKSPTEACNPSSENDKLWFEDESELVGETPNDGPEGTGVKDIIDEEVNKSVY